MSESTAKKNVLVRRSDRIYDVYALSEGGQRMPLPHGEYGRVNRFKQSGYDFGLFGACDWAWAYVSRDAESIVFVDYWFGRRFVETMEV